MLNLPWLCKVFRTSKSLPSTQCSSLLPRNEEKLPVFCLSFKMMTVRLGVYNRRFNVSVRLTPVWFSHAVSHNFVDDSTEKNVICIGQPFI